MGDADLVSATPPWARRVSYFNPEWAEVGQDSEGENGRKTGEVGERESV